MSSLAPIALFVYRRPSHTKACIDALLKNELAADSLLYIFSDSPKTQNDKGLTDEVRKYIHTVRGFANVEIIERNDNLGLARSVISGVTEVVGKHGKIIVLEDDHVVSPFFLKYMNDALNLYLDENKVISIHGYVYPVAGNLPETFFLKGADCWGWGTWKRGWDLFEEDSQMLYNDILSRKLENEFDYDGAANYMLMLKRQIEGGVDSWAVRWYASAFLKDKLTLYPGRSLLKNIGMDNLGTHTKKTSAYDIHLSESPINVSPIAVVENETAKKLFRDFHLSTQPNLIIKFLKKLKRKLNSN